MQATESQISVAPEMNHFTAFSHDLRGLFWISQSADKRYL